MAIDEAKEAQIRQEAVEADRAENTRQWRQKQIFGWYDEVAYRKAHPLALVARAIEMVDLLTQIEHENDTGDRFVTQGLSAALSSLVKAGKYDEAGLPLECVRVPSKRRGAQLLAVG